VKTKGMVEEVVARMDEEDDDGHILFSFEDCYISSVHYLGGRMIVKMTPGTAKWVKLTDPETSGEG